MREDLTTCMRAIEGFKQMQEEVGTEPVSLEDATVRFVAAALA
jgi:hypothetical protein